MTDNDFKKVRPEEVGVEPKSIVNFIENIREKRVNLHSFVLLRRGKVAAEGYYQPFNKTALHQIFSVSKSITSAAAGIAIGEGLLTLEDRVVDFFPEKVAGEVHPYTARMKVKHLLSMQTVHRKSTNKDTDDWVASFLNTPPSHPPGTVFAYDTTGTHTLCAILQKVTGTTVHEYLDERLFQKIGIGPIDWEMCPMGINMGGGGIFCSTEDMARFGQLYLQNGVWNGKQVLPDGWVQQSTSRIVDNSNTNFQLDGRQGYGYQFWRARHDSYCAFGAGGQLILVIPEKEVVFVTTANTMQGRDEHQLILDSFWDTIYRELKIEPIKHDDNSYALMQQKLQNLKLSLPPAGKEEFTCRDSVPISQMSQLRYVMEDNKLGIASCMFKFGEKTSLTLYSQRKETRLPFKIDAWITAADPFFGMEAACGAVWADRATCIIKLELLEYKQMFILTCCFRDDTLLLQIKPFGALKTDHLDVDLAGTVTEDLIR